MYFSFDGGTGNGGKDPKSSGGRSLWLNGGGDCDCGRGGPGGGNLCSSIGILSLLSDCGGGGPGWKSS